MSRTQPPTAIATEPASQAAPPRPGGRAGRLTPPSCSLSSAMEHSESREKAVDLRHMVRESGRLAHLDGPRPRQLDRDDLLDTARTRGHDRNPVGHEDRLGDLVRDENGGTG